MRLECAICNWEIGEEAYRCEECGAMACGDCLRIEGERYCCH